MGQTIRVLRERSWSKVMVKGHGRRVDLNAVMASKLVDLHASVKDRQNGSNRSITGRELSFMINTLGFQ